MGKPKAMTGKRYMAEFSRSARWRLGGAEAEEAIADYREMVYQEGRDEAKLVEELGDPVQAAWLLTDAREYKRWQRVFAVLVCCALFCAEWAFDGLPFYWHWDILPNASLPSETFTQFLIPTAAALLLTLFWFRRTGRRSGPASWRLMLALAGAALIGSVVALLVWRSFDMTWNIWGEDGRGYYTPEFAAVMELVIDAGFLAPIAGVAGLYLARCYDRRWAAFFILCMTVSVMCLMSQKILLDVNPEGGTIHMVMMRRELFFWLLPTAGAGVIGAGVALK